MLTKRDRIDTKLAKKLINAMHNAPTTAQLANMAGKGVVSAAVITEVTKAVKAAMKSNKGNNLRGSRSNPAVETTSAPASMGAKITSYAARTTPTRGGGVRIKYRELVSSSILGNQFYSPLLPTGVESFEINPGLSSMFPWLSVQAVQYEQYRIHGLTYYYVPFVNTGTNGDIMMMVDYNVLDRPPQTEQQFLDHPGAVIGSVWEALAFKANSSNMHAIGPRKFVRPCAIAGDLKTYDVGRFYITSSNVSTEDIPLGKLFVEYDIELFTPQLVAPPSTGPVTMSQFVVNGVVGPAITFVSGVTKLLDIPYMKYNPLNIAYSAGSPGIYRPPAGTYAMIASLTISAGTTLTSANFGFTLNGSSLDGVNGINYVAATGTDEKTTSFCMTAIIPCNGTDIVSIAGQLTGTGALSIPSLYWRWELA